jgi:hypothetical protein
MKSFRTFLCSLLVLAVLAASADAHWCVGVRIGVPLWFPGCYGYYPGYYYYAPRPVYVVQPTAVVAPTNVVPATVAVPAYSSPVPAAQPSYAPPSTLPAPSPPIPEGGTTQARYAVSTAEPPLAVSVAGLVQSLASPDERVRLDGVTQLGRLKALSAIDPLAATLAGDHSAAVREAAARALAFIGSPSAVPALSRAVQVDPDHNVRLSAEFALDVLGSR